MMTWVTHYAQPLAATGTAIFIQLIHCHDAWMWVSPLLAATGLLPYGDECILFQAFDFKAEVQWSFLHRNHADAYEHAKRLGLANERMRNFRPCSEDPYFWCEILVFQPADTFKQFFQTKTGLYQ